MTNARGVDADRAVFAVGHACAHLLQNFNRLRNVADLRDIIQHTGTAHENRRKKDGKRGVFHSADRNISVQGLAATNNDFGCHAVIHGGTRLTRSNSPFLQFCLPTDKKSIGNAYN